MPRRGCSPCSGPRRPQKEEARFHLHDLPQQAEARYFRAQKGRKVSCPFCDSCFLTSSPVPQVQLLYDSHPVSALVSHTSSSRARNPDRWLMPDSALSTEYSTGRILNASTTSRLNGRKACMSSSHSLCPMRHSFEFYALYCSYLGARSWLVSMPFGSASVRTLMVSVAPAYGRA